MTLGQPFLQALLGSNARIVNEAAFGADLTDIDGSGWTWTDLGSDPRHIPGIPITVGRTDNVGQAGAASYSTTLNNQAGDYTPGGPNAAHNVTQNTPFRQRMTLDGTTWFIRFQGYLDSANPVTDQSAKVKGVAVGAFGMLARLGGLKKPLKSALYRSISAASPLAWWPMEEGSAATQLASGVPGGRPITVTPGAAPGATGGPGLAAAVDFTNGGALSVVLPSTISASGIHLGFAFSPLETTNDSWPVLQFQTGADTWYLFVDRDDTDGTSLFELDWQPPDPGIGVGAVAQTVTYQMDIGSWHWISVDIVQSGANVNINMGIDDEFGSFTPMLTGYTLTRPTALMVARPATDFEITSTMFKVSNLAFFSSSSTSLIQLERFNATQGWAGETADARMTRLCLEQGVALDLTGTSNVAMGPQPLDTFLNLLRECEAADHGVLYDGLGPGVGYQCRSARYNAPGVLTLDMGADPPQVTSFGPVFDKQAVKNLYTVTRKDGGSATAEQTDGPIGTNLIGIEDAAVTISTETDDVLAQHATWLVHLGTVEGFRFPATGLNMRGVPSKAAGILALGIGERITLHRPASKATDLPPDDIGLIVEGWTETTSASTWDITLTTSPYDPWRAAAVADPTNPWVVAPGAAALNANINATVVSASIKSTDGTLLSTSAGDYPRNVVIGGEEITISSVTGSSSPQTAVIVRSVNGVVKSHLANDPVTLYKPAAIAL